jgi:hypothetical protein
LTNKYGDQQQTESMPKLRDFAEVLRNA